MKPLKIRQTNQGTLLFVWDDGHESVFPTDFLRSHCPCATCQRDREENAKEGLLALPLANQVELRRIELSGHNAAILSWGDGHNTGIFTWEYLRGLCLCEECRKLSPRDI